MFFSVNERLFSVVSGYQIHSVSVVYHTAECLDTAEVRSTGGGGAEEEEER